MGRYRSTTDMQFSIFNFQFPKNIPDARRSEAGFSLVEMIVAIGLFAIVMVVCVATLFALVNANRKAQALQSVISNLNIALDGMARSLRMGSHYHCGASGSLPDPQDCSPTGETQLSFLRYGGNVNNVDDYTVYKYDSGAKQLLKSERGGQSGTFFSITAPEVTIDTMSFYVRGSTRGCDPLAGGGCLPIQPSVIAVVTGTAAAANAKARSTFHIQVAATQRLIDL